MGLTSRESGNTLEHAMTARGLQYYFVRSEGAIRTNIKLFDQSNHILTEVNEAGPNVSFAAIEKLVDEIDVRLDHTHILVLSGSVPPGVPPISISASSTWPTKRCQDCAGHHR